MKSITKIILIIIATLAGGYWTYTGYDIYTSAKKYDRPKSEFIELAKQGKGAFSELKDDHPETLAFMHTFMKKSSKLRASLGIKGLLAGIIYLLCAAVLYKNKPSYAFYLTSIILVIVAVSIIQLGDRFIDANLIIVGPAVFMFAFLWKHRKFQVRQTSQLNLV